MEIDKIIKKELNQNIDLEYKKFNSSLCNSRYNMLGVRIPILRNIAKKMASSDIFDVSVKKEYILSYNDICYEELMIKGFMIEYVKDFPFFERLELLEKYIPHVDNWGICDSVCATLKFIKKDKDKVWQFLDKYFNSQKEFEKRIAIVISMDYFIEDNYIDKVFYKYKTLELNEYYSKMALAWALSKIYVYYKDKTISFLRLNILDDFTHNKAIQKMIESFRISDKDKLELRKLKKTRF